MFDFFKNKKQYPAFWEAYLSCFQTKSPETIQENTYVVFDTETTGFDLKNDRILSIGAIKIKQQRFQTSTVFERYIHQSTFNPASVAIHGIIKKDLDFQESEADVVKDFLAYIGNTVLVGHHTAFDMAMLNQALSRMGLPNLKNKTMDTMYLFRASRIHSNLIDKNKRYSLDEVAEKLHISVKDRHTAAGDAYITAIAFLKLVARLSKQKNGRLKDLLKLGNK